MSWELAHVRWRALREVGAAIEAGGGDDLPWNDRLQAVFGDRRFLVEALRYRCQLTMQAQLDPELPAETLADTRRAIAAANRGLLRVLARYADLDGPVGQLALDYSALGRHA